MPRHRLRSERGAKALELMLVFPMFVLLVAAIEHFGEVPGGAEVVHSAADFAWLDSSQLGLPLFASIIAVFAGTVATLWRR